MSKKTKNIPKLRFPEFVDSGEWEEREFSNYIKLYRGSSPRPIQEYLTQDSNGVNWIKIGDTKNAINFIIDKVEEKITSKGAQKSRKVEIGELILANSMSFGKTYELKIEGCIYDGWFVLREYEEYFYKPFLLQLLNSEYMQQQYKNLSAGGIVQNISGDIVNKTMIFHTSINEQQKIADFLSSVDELITSSTKKVELLKEHKKGLMQQLFPQEGESVPRLRFPEFVDDGDWEEKELGELFKLKQGVQCGVENQFYEKKDGYIKFIRIVDLTSDAEPERYIKDPGIEHHIDEDDLFMVRYGVAGLVGYGYKGVIANNLFRFIPIKKNKVHNKFFYFLFNFINSSFQQLAGSSTMPALNFKSLNTLTLLFPLSIDEQQKIADCLSSLDELITLSTKKVELLKEHKKGLMQQLFPSSEE